MTTTITKKNRNRRITDSVLDTDWEFGDANTKELTHEIHRYSGKYIPQIARRAIELISVPGEIVLDPYVGSGTTLLEANLAGRHSIGVDLNPLAVLIARVKTTPIEESRLDKAVSYFQELMGSLSATEKGLQSLLAEINDSKKISEAAQRDPRTEDIWYRKWFSRDTLKDLLIIDYAINAYPDKEVAELARLALSNILRRCSNAHSGYPNVMLDRSKDNQTAPAPLFLKSLIENAGRVKEMSERFDKNLRTDVIHGDATELPLANNSVDAVVTHPPYIGSVPYAEYGVLSLHWLGHDPKILDNKLTGGRRQSKDVVDRFIAGYKKMLQESYRVLKSGRHMFILIGDPVVKGQFIDLAQITRELSVETGFRIDVEKKRNGVNRRANKMGAETLLFFQK